MTTHNQRMIKFSYHLGDLFGLFPSDEMTYNDEELITILNMAFTEVRPDLIVIKEEEYVRLEENQKEEVNTQK